LFVLGLPVSFYVKPGILDFLVVNTSIFGSYFR
jgi:hypothetical protein